MNTNIAFFDFDGTITKKDTLLEFIQFSKGKSKFVFGFLLNSPSLVAYKLGLISNQSAKEKVLQHFFGGDAITDFDNTCRQFANEILPQLIRPKALPEIEKLKKENFTIVIVSASPENWIRPWAAQTGVEFLCSQLHIVHEKLTGKLIGKNCYGTEKVARIKQQYNLADYKKIYAYGDTPGDKPMLALATESFYKPFQ